MYTQDSVVVPVSGGGHWTTGLLDYWTTGPLDYWATGPLGNWTTGLLAHWTTGSLDHWTTGQNSVGISDIQCCIIGLCCILYQKQRKKFEQHIFLVLQHVWHSGTATTLFIHFYSHFRMCCLYQQDMD